MAYLVLHEISCNVGFIINYIHKLIKYKYKFFLVVADNLIDV